MIPKVSVIIPNFNNGIYIKEAIQSCLNQTLPIYEIIIVDNFSKDSTHTIVNKFQQNHKNIYFYKYKNYGIVANSRNFGIRMSKGNIVAFLDSDDYWLENKIQECILLIKNGYDMVCHPMINQKKYPHLNSRINFIDVYSNPNIIIPSSIVIKKNNMSPFEFTNNIRYNTSEDYFYILNLLLNKKKIFFINKKLSFYRLHSNNLSKRVYRQYLAELNTIKYYFKLNSEKKIISYKIYCKRIARLYFSKSKYYFFNKKLYFAKKNLKLFLYFYSKSLIFKNIF